MTEPVTLQGACLCGKISFEMEPPFRDVLICNCTQCAKWTGHQVAATGVSPERLNITSGEESLTWFRSSDTADRGFCGICGSSLFWRPDEGDRISIMAGTVDDPTGQLKVAAHWYVADQRHYVSTAGDAPQYPQDTPPAEQTGD